ncbi:MAG: peptidylprolyl isomerase [Rhodospirillales bacterium]|nr:peptidylprolyl isomerase [Rhodospirillales bacterium]
MATPRWTALLWAGSLLLAAPMATALAQSVPAAPASGLSLGPAFPALPQSVAPGSSPAGGTSAHGGARPAGTAGTASGEGKAAKPATPFATPRALDLGSAPDRYAPGEAVANPTDPIVATVDGMRIRLSDVGAFIQTLPAAERAIPYPELFPRVVNTLIGRKALVAEAYRLGLDKTKAVEQQMRDATDLALQGATLTHDIAPLITEREIHARYLRDIAGRPGPVEIELGVITVATKEDAAAIIAKLQGGADFATLARQDSRDPSAFKGGNLGWLRQDQMQPDIAAAALALQAGQVWPYPMDTHGAGWLVIKALDRRRAATPSYEQAHDELRNQIIVEAVRKITAEAEAKADIRRYNMDGKAAQTLGPGGAPIEGSR